MNIFSREYLFTKACFHPAISTCINLVSFSIHITQENKCVGINFFLLSVYLRLLIEILSVIGNLKVKSKME